MIKRKIYVLPLLLLAFMVVSCDETQESSKYDNWQERNEAFIDSLQTVYDAKSDPDLKMVVDERNKKNIFYKVISKKEVAQKEPPYFTSTVKMYYRGVLIDEAVFGAKKAKYYTSLYKNLTVFNQNFKGDNPEGTDSPGNFLISESSLTTGWSAVLVHMHPGERWEVYIPYQSAYGTSGYNDIPGYTTLIFDMEMVEVVTY